MSNNNKKIKVQKSVNEYDDDYQDDYSKEYEIKRLSVKKREGS